MALIDTIRATMRNVVGSSSGLGEAWYYRTPITAPTEQTAPRYSAWTAVDGVVSGYLIAEVADARTGRLIQRQRQFIRLTDAIGTLPNGSQVSKDKTPATTWAVDEIASGQGGTIRYLIGRDLTERGQSNRGGGVA